MFVVKAKAGESEERSAPQSYTACKLGCSPSGCYCYFRLHFFSLCKGCISSDYSLVDLTSTFMQLWLYCIARSSAAHHCPPTQSIPTLTCGAGIPDGQAPSSPADSGLDGRNSMVRLGSSAFSHHRGSNCWGLRAPNPPDSPCSTAANTHAAAYFFLILFTVVESRYLGAAMDTGSLLRGKTGPIWRRATRVDSAADIELEVIS